jgi:hypothetical protein
MIPDNISKESVFDAIGDINKNGIPENRHSDKYFLLYDNFLYPPKYVLSIANKFVNGKELDSIGFSTRCIPIGTSAFGTCFRLYIFAAGTPHVSTPITFENARS